MNINSYAFYQMSKKEKGLKNRQNNNNNKSRLPNNNNGQIKITEFSTTKI